MLIYVGGKPYAPPPGRVDHQWSTHSLASATQKNSSKACTPQVQSPPLNACPIFHSRLSLLVGHKLILARKIHKYIIYHSSSPRLAQRKGGGELLQPPPGRGPFWILLAKIHIIITGCATLRPRLLLFYLFFFIAINSFMCINITITMVIFITT